MTNLINICFMGSPEFSVPSLISLIEANFKIKAVFTQKPKPANRGKKVLKQPIHMEADKLGLPVMTPKNLKNDATKNYLQKLDLDFIVVVAYGHILPKEILDIPKYGCINLHASLLPRWRGAAPIHRAIMAGDDKTGISIMLMSEGLDEGEILSIQEFAISEEDTINILSNKLAYKGAELLVKTIPKFKNGLISSIAQKNHGITYAEKIKKNDQILNFNNTAKSLIRKINALSPVPGAKCKIKGEIVKIIKAELIQNTEKIKEGTIITDDLVIKCKTDSIRILSLQRPGKKIMTSREVLNGWKIKKNQNIEKLIL